MSDRPALVQQLMAITGCNDFQARTVLERCNWDTERALNSFFDDPPPEQAVASSNTQSSSNAIVPFQGPSESQHATSGWNTPTTQAYGPPPGPPPSSQGWGQNDKDLTNDADADADLRRAMAASLQDHQSQQSYKPPAPSSTVGVSHTTAKTAWNSSGQEATTRRRLGLTVNQETILHEGAPTPEVVVDLTEDEPMHAEAPNRNGIIQIEQMEEASSHGYQLRDRKKLARPSNTAEPLFDSSRPNKQQRTYGRVGGTSSRGTCSNSSLWNDETRRPGRATRGRRGRGAAARDRRMRSWSTDLGMSEDEQLRQALEASVQSHHDLLQSSGSGARTPALPQHLETDLHTRRFPGSPIAMVAPFASLEVVAALLQALFATPPVRRAYLAARPPDSRGSDFSNYWKGTAPTDSINSEAGPKPTLEAQFELGQRIQTLFAFAQLSQRPLCVVKDVASLAPSEVVARGADHSPAVRVAVLFHEFLVSSFTKHAEAAANIIRSTPGAEPNATDHLWMDNQLFNSSGAAALTHPASPRSGANGSPVVAGPKGEQERSFIQLRHDSVNSDTYSCLRAALASDGEGALLTKAGRTSSMAIDHALPTPEGRPAPFTIHERIHLDSLMWDRRQGVRLDAELRDLEMVRLDGMRQELEARKVKLLGDGGRPSTEVLSGARRYFETVASPLNGVGDDAIRSSSLAEAAPQIGKIQEAVQADLAATDALIGQIRAKIDAKRARVAQRAKAEACNPEWMQLGYDLCAVLCHEAGRCTSFVKQDDGSWWKIANGKAVQVEREEVVMGRAEDASLSVFWVVYARVEEDTRAKQGEEGQGEGLELISEPIKAAVADDNLTYESELLSLIRSDAASPARSTVSVDGEQQQQQQQQQQGKEVEWDSEDGTNMAIDGESQVGNTMETRTE